MKRTSSLMILLILLHSAQLWAAPLPMPSSNCPMQQMMDMTMQQASDSRAEAPMASANVVETMADCCDNMDAAACQAHCAATAFGLFTPSVLNRLPKQAKSEQSLLSGQRLPPHDVPLLRPPQSLI